MVLFLILAVANGAVNIINKMVNLRAKQSLGTANGTLINYLEGTLLSLAVVLLAGNFRLTDLSYLKTVPPVYFLGGLFGLISMVLILIGMSKNQISFSTVVVLVGQLGAGLLIDTIAAGRVAPLKIAGMVLVILGVAADKYLFRKTAGQAPAKAAENQR